MKKPKVRREDLAPDACLCEHCTGKCCRYFSLPVETPTSRSHFDAIGRYLAHDKSIVYVDKETWYLLVSTRCKYLGADYRCGVYFDRPKVCREYTTTECEYDEDWSFEKLFETPEQVAEYADALLPKRKRPALAKGILPKGHRAGAACSCFRVPIDTPRTWDDYDAVRWYLAHGQSLVYVQRGAWYLLVLSGGRGDAAAKRCKFETITPEAEQNGGAGGSGKGRNGLDLVFETSEQLWEHAAAVLPARRRPRSTGSSLPIISLG